METKTPIRQIADLVALEYGVHPTDIYGRRQTGNIANARELVCWLAETVAGHDRLSIARQLGDQNYATISHAYELVAARRSDDPAFQEMSDILAAAIRVFDSTALHRAAADPEPHEIVNRILGNPRREAIQVSVMEAVALANALFAHREIAQCIAALLTTNFEDKDAEAAIAKALKSRLETAGYLNYEETKS